MTRRIAILAVMLAMILAAAPAAPFDALIACAPDARCVTGSEVASAVAGAGREVAHGDIGEAVNDVLLIAAKISKDSAPLLLGAGSLLVAGVFVAGYRIVRPWCLSTRSRGRTRAPSP